MTYNCYSCAGRNLIAIMLVDARLRGQDRSVLPSLCGSVCRTLIFYPVTVGLCCLIQLVFAFFLDIFCCWRAQLEAQPDAPQANFVAVLQPAWTKPQPIMV